MVKLNVHCRLFSAPPEALQRWIEATWSGTPQDAFPRDVIKSWRKNPPGVDPLALVPGKTKLGHGGFTFHFREWNGERWRVEFNGPWFSGWHGFELRELNGGAHLMHTISLQATGLGILLWRLLIEPIHDWAVEAMFDRLETAVATGSIPEHTARPMGRHARCAFWLLSRIVMKRSRQRHRRREAIA